jgi:hypothetical protein
MENKPDRFKVFLSYSKSDCEWAERLMAHLNKAESMGLVEYWSDQQLELGDSWNKEITKAIKEAKVFVILVSPNYIASPFCADIEFPLIKEAADDGALILPILVNPVSFSSLKGLQQYQFFNSEALKSLPPRQQEKLLLEVAEKINTAIIEHKRKIESNSSQVLASTIGGAIIGSMIIPGIGGALLGGFFGGALGNTKKEDKDDA